NSKALGTAIPSSCDPTTSAVPMTNRATRQSPEQASISSASHRTTASMKLQNRTIGICITVVPFSLMVLSSPFRPQLLRRHAKRLSGIGHDLMRLLPAAFGPLALFPMRHQIGQSGKKFLCLRERHE